MKLGENASERSRNFVSRLATHIAKCLTHVVIPNEAN
jgi:hypothetical protein